MIWDEWRTYWTQLKRDVDEELCSEALGLDLLRGELLNTGSNLNSSHLQVFGKSAFLRNMLQRILTCDAGQKLPLIILAPEKEHELLEEVFKIWNDKNIEKDESFFLYSRFLRTSPPSFKSSEFFRIGACQFVYAKLEEQGSPVDKRLLSIFETEIQKLSSGGSSLSEDKRPLVYIFHPELLESSHDLAQYAKRLKAHATFRVFSAQVQVFGREEASFLYGPGLYPTKTYERMRKHCYWQFEQKRKWDRKHSFFGDPENPAVLKEMRAFSSTIPVSQTAFGCFKTSYEPGHEYVWFYPVCQSLEKMSVPPVTADIENEPKSVTAGPELPLSQENTAIQDIINDLKPKSREGGRV